MKAITLTKYGSADDLKLEEVACPVPKADEVLIRVHASAINDCELAVLLGLIHFTGLIDAGKILPAIDSRYSLEEVPAAINHFQSSKHKGKVIVSVTGVTAGEA